LSSFRNNFQSFSQGKIDLSQIAVDGSFSPFTGRRRVSGTRLQRMGVPIHLLVEASGKPIAVSGTTANGDERMVLFHKKTL
jgi:hypothetical protein